MNDRNTPLEHQVSQLKAELAHWKATAHENAGTVPQDAMTAELQAVRARNLKLTATLKDIRDVLHDDPGVQKGNSKVHYAYHKAEAGMSI